MHELWFSHLSSGLSSSGLIAYIWHPAQDRFEWAGDVAGVLGLAPDNCPQTNAQFHKILNPQYVPERLALLHTLMREGKSDAFGASLTTRYKIRRANGAHIDIEESMSLREDKGEKILCGFLHLENRKELNAKGAEDVREIKAVATEVMAHHSRHFFYEKIEAWKDEAAEQKTNPEGYILVAGIDRLTLMNEAFGARYADELIEKTGARLLQIAGANGIVARIDGDVFAIFFPQAPHSEMAAVAQSMLNNFFDMPLQTSKGPVGVSISIGGIRARALSADDPASLITKGEMAMRAAKEKGRNCFMPYDEASQQNKNCRLLLESGEEFLQALKDNRLMLAFQPVLGAQTQDVTFHESLVRMLSLDGKMLPAGDFIPAVEKLGLSRLVDQYALRMAIDELALFPTLTLSVNVSNLTLANPDWLRGIVSSLRDRPSIARRLIIEVTESAATHDVKQTIRIVKTLKDLGCRVALDDFGAGYTAFSQIKDLDVDIVKIDKSFVRGIDEEQNQLFVRTLQSLANGVNVETVGEGAETMADARRLASDGINHIQGYVFGFPRVERVWLPKDHSHRQIALSQTFTEAQKESHTEFLADIKLGGY
jgi:diguanylate cyclase (GGDEF)-like protein